MNRIANRVKEYFRPFYLRSIYFPLFPDRCPFSPGEYWREPYQRLPFSSPVPSAQALAVVFYPMNDWHGRTQRTHHLARLLAERGYTVIYVNPHLGRQYDTGRWDRSPRLSRLDNNLFELHVRLPREPVFHHRNLEAAESRVVAGAVSSALASLGISMAVQVLSFPIWLGAALLLRQSQGFPIAYDCHDRLSGFANIAGEIIALEPEALRAADLALFSSAGLLEEHVASGAVAQQNARLLRNAVDIEHFRVVGAGDPARAVYAGAVENWFDTEAVRLAAARNPSCQFRIAGRVDAPHVRQALERIPNLELLGEVPYQRLPEILQARVGLIPFLVDKLTLATNPIKLYEYFACGLPVVSSALPEVQAFKDLVYIAGSPEEFAACVTRALEESDPLQQQRRRAVAEGESWHARVDALEGELGELLGRGANSAAGAAPVLNRILTS